MSFGSVDAVFNWCIELPVEEHRVIVATGTPLGGPRSDYILHVLDGFPIPLVVERRKVVHGGIPLLVNIRVAALADLRGQKEVGRDGFASSGCR